MEHDLHNLKHYGGISWSDSGPSLLEAEMAWNQDTWQKYLRGGNGVESGPSLSEAEMAWNQESTKQSGRKSQEGVIKEKQKYLNVCGSEPLP